MLILNNIYTYLFVCFSFSVCAQVSYPTGNDAYMEEKYHGFRDVQIADGSFIYTYHPEVKQYRFEQYVLIPDLNSESNGHYMDTLNMCGLGINGTISDTSFQWDNQCVTDDFSPFDVPNMFVSPVSESPMHYAAAMHFGTGSCYSENCTVDISSPDSTLAYQDTAVPAGTYNLWFGEELVEAGDLKGTGTVLFVSQQQLDTGNTQSYCTKTYGRGWRIPTDLEVGHFNDLEELENGFDTAYMGSNFNYMWTSSLFKTYAVKRWPVKINDGFWENCAGFLYVANYVRCVFPGYNNENALTVQPISTPEIILSPNPVSQTLNISSKEKNMGMIRIYSSTGQILHTISADNNQHYISLNISEYRNGIYLISVSFNDGSINTKKIIKQHE